MEILKVCIIGVCGTLLAVQFKNGKTEYGIYISVALSLIIFGGLLGRLQILINSIREISSYITNETEYITTLFKMIGITYICELASSICKDAGYQTISQQIEIFGKLSVFVLGMPVLITLLQTVRGFLT